MSQVMVQIDFTQLSKRDVVIAIDAARNIVVVAFADSESVACQEISATCIDFGFTVEELSSGLLVHTGYGYLPDEVAQLIALALEKVGLKVDRDFPVHYRSLSDNPTYRREFAAILTTTEKITKKLHEIGMEIPAIIKQSWDKESSRREAAENA